MNKILRHNNFLNRTKWAVLLISSAVFLPIVHAEPYQNDRTYEITVPIRIENIKKTKRTYYSLKIHTKPQNADYFTVTCVAHNKLLTNVSDLPEDFEIRKKFKANLRSSTDVKIKGNNTLTSATFQLTVPYKDIKKYPYYFCGFDVFFGSKKTDRVNIQESLSRLLVSGKFPTKSQ